MSDLNLVENIIRDKYGDLGVRVFNLIDGQRNTEQIMNATGVSESKLIEMLGFMEQKNIIKMRYPREDTVQPFNVTLPIYIRQKMQKHSEVNWTEVIPKLISLYVNSLEKNIELLSFKLPSKTKLKVKKPKPKKPKVKKKKKASKTIKKKSKAKKRSKTKKK